MDKAAEQLLTSIESKEEAEAQRKLKEKEHAAILEEVNELVRLCNPSG